MWLLAAPVAAYLLLAAHFFRAELLWLAVASVALIPVLAVPRAWAAHLTRIVLLLGALEWVRTAAVIAVARYSAGAALGRMIAILSAVALLTILATLVFRHRTLRGFYGLGTRGRSVAPVRAD